MISLQDIQLIRYLLGSMSDIDEEVADLMNRLDKEIHDIKHGSELDFWMSARAGKVKTAAGVVSDRLAETRNGQLRVKMPCERHVMRQVLALCAEGSVNLILESRT